MVIKQLIATKIGFHKRMTKVIKELEYELVLEKVQHYDVIVLV